MAPGLRAGLVEMFERRSRQLELAGRLEADRPVRPAQRDHLAGFLDGLPAELGQAHEQVAYSARLLVGGGAMIVAPIDELLMLGADPPRILRLLALDEGGQQILAAFD